MNAKYKISKKYKYILNAFGAKNESPHKRIDRPDVDVGTSYAMMNGGKLCVSLYHYNESLWEDSICNDPEFMKQLNGYRYEQSLKYAKEHAQFTDFIGYD